MGKLSALSSVNEEELPHGPCHRSEATATPKIVRHGGRSRPSSRQRLPKSRKEAGATIIAVVAPPLRSSSSFAIILLLVSCGHAAADADGNGLAGPSPGRRHSHQQRREGRHRDPPQPPQRRQLPTRSASNPFLPDYLTSTCRNDAPAESWQTDVPSTAAECCARYFGWDTPAGSCEQATRAWLMAMMSGGGEDREEYYPDSAAGVCRVATATTASWITTRESDYEGCCRSWFGWNPAECLAADPAHATSSLGSASGSSDSSGGSGDDVVAISFGDGDSSPSSGDDFDSLVVVTTLPPTAPTPGGGSKCDALARKECTKSTTGCRYDMKKGCVADGGNEGSVGGPEPSSTSCQFLSKDECIANSGQCEWKKKSGCTTLPILVQNSSPSYNVSSGGSSSSSSSDGSLPILAQNSSPSSTAASSDNDNAIRGSIGSSLSSSSDESLPILVQNSSPSSIGSGSNSVSSSSGSSSSSSSIDNSLPVLTDNSSPSFTADSSKSDPSNSAVNGSSSSTAASSNNDSSTSGSISTVCQFLPKDECNVNSHMCKWDKKSGCIILPTFDNNSSPSSISSVSVSANSGSSSSSDASLTIPAENSSPSSTVVSSDSDSSINGSSSTLCQFLSKDECKVNSEQCAWDKKSGCVTLYTLVQNSSPSSISSASVSANSGSSSSDASLPTPTENSSLSPTALNNDSDSSINGSSGTLCQALSKDACKVNSEQCAWEKKSGCATLYILVQNSPPSSTGSGSDSASSGSISSSDDSLTTPTEISSPSSTAVSSDSDSTINGSNGTLCQALSKDKCKVNSEQCAWDKKSGCATLYIPVQNSSPSSIGSGSNSDSGSSGSSSSGSDDILPVLLEISSPSSTAGSSDSDSAISGSSTTLCQALSMDECKFISEQCEWDKKSGCITLPIDVQNSSPSSTGSGSGSVSASSGSISSSSDEPLPTLTDKSFSSSIGSTDSKSVISGSSSTSCQFLSKDECKVNFEQCEWDKKSRCTTLPVIIQNSSPSSTGSVSGSVSASSGSSSSSSNDSLFILAENSSPSSPSSTFGSSDSDNATSESSLTLCPVLSKEECKVNSEQCEWDKKSGCAILPILVQSSSPSSTSSGTTISGSSSSSTSSSRDIGNGSSISSSRNSIDCPSASHEQCEANPFQCTWHKKKRRCEWCADCIILNNAPSGHSFQGTSGASPASVTSKPTTTSGDDSVTVQGSVPLTESWWYLADDGCKMDGPSRPQGVTGIYREYEECCKNSWDIEGCLLLVSRSSGDSSRGYSNSSGENLESDDVGDRVVTEWYYDFWYGGCKPIDKSLPGRLPEIFDDYTICCKKSWDTAECLLSENNPTNSNGSSHLRMFDTSLNGRNNDSTAPPVLLDLNLFGTVDLHLPSLLSKNPKQLNLLKKVLTKSIVLLMADYSALVHPEYIEVDLLSIDGLDFTWRKRRLGEKSVVEEEEQGGLEGRELDLPSPSLRGRKSVAVQQEPPQQRQKQRREVAVQELKFELTILTKCNSACQFDTLSSLGTFPSALINDYFQTAVTFGAFTVLLDTEGKAAGLFANGLPMASNGVLTYVHATRSALNNNENFTWPLSISPIPYPSGTTDFPLEKLSGGGATQQKSSRDPGVSGGDFSSEGMVYYPKLQLGVCKFDGLQGNTLDLYSSLHECCLFPWMVDYSRCMSNSKRANI